MVHCKNNFVIAKLTAWVWCGVAIMKRGIVYLFTDRLHVKAAELCLNNSVMTTKYVKCINSIHGTCPQQAYVFLSRGVGKVLL